MQLPMDERHGYTRDYVEGRLGILMGGRSAEMLIFNEMTTGAGNDIEQATQIAKKMATEWGMSDLLGPMTFGKKSEEVFLGRDMGGSRDYSETTARMIDEEVSRIVRDAQRLADEILRKDINHGAIVMALNRLSINLEFQHTHRIIKVLKKIGDITVRSNLVDYNFKVSDSLLINQSSLLKNLDVSKNNFYTSSRGVDECNIVVSANLSKLVEEKLTNEFCFSRTENLCSISFKLPEENVSIPGIYYFVFQKLSWDGINVSQIISTSNDSQSLSMK